MKQLGSFNREGAVPHDHNDPLDLPSASEDAVAESAGASPADDSEEGGEQEDVEFSGYAEVIENDVNAPVVDGQPVENDANGDGHDDQTGQFVTGNQEAANPDDNADIAGEPA